MLISEYLLPEFDREALLTRVLLDRVPGDQAAWQPHARARSLGELALHIAGLPSWCAITLQQTEFDPNPADRTRTIAPAFESTAHLLNTYDEAARSARTILARASDAEFMVPWTLKNGGRIMFSMPRIAAFRSFVMNHAVHHRGQLSVYLRMLDVPLPNIYGPTAGPGL